MNTILPTAKECIDMLVTCEGNNLLAAELLTKKVRASLQERLNAEGVYVQAVYGNEAPDPSTITITTSDMVSIITADPDAIAMLTTQMRTFALIKTLSALGKTTTSFEAALGDMESKDIARTFTNLIEQVSRLTDNHSSTINVNNNRELVFKMLPPEMAEVIQMLALDKPPAPQQMNIIEADGD